MIKYDSLGNVIDTAIYDGLACDWAIETTVDHFDYIIVTGVTGSTWGDPDNDYYTIKYAEPPLGVESTPSNRYKLYSNYPNPVREVTVIKYEVPASTKAILKIYDLSGRVVNIFESTGGNKIIWNRQDSNDKKLPSGIYFYELDAGANRSIKKMVVM